MHSFQVIHREQAATTKTCTRNNVATQCVDECQQALVHSPCLKRQALQGWRAPRSFFSIPFPLLVSVLVLVPMLPLVLIFFLVPVLLLLVVPALFMAAVPFPVLLLLVLSTLVHRFIDIICYNGLLRALTC